MKIITSFLIFLFIVSCKQQETKKDYLGVVNITISGNKSALPHFEKGLLLLHSFEYEDAREAFQKAKMEDPEMTMAYWGEAMTYNHSLWQEQDYEAATTVLAKLNSLDLEKIQPKLKRI
jgi:tetratricopeptide (TPR) repeat protein